VVVAIGAQTGREKHVAPTRCAGLTMQSVPSKMREEHRPPLLKCLQDSVALHSGHALLLCGVA
jgi:hypothetical protein